MLVSIHLSLPWEVDEMLLTQFYDLEMFLFQKHKLIKLLNF